MTIDWNRFTPVAALSGGVLIGLALLILYYSTVGSQESAASSAASFVSKRATLGGELLSLSDCWRHLFFFRVAILIAQYTY